MPGLARLMVYRQTALSLICLFVCFDCPRALAEQQQQHQVAPAGDELLQLDSDVANRLTVSVNVGDQGPFQFLVDTGAERTVISRELAEKLDLPTASKVRVHSITDAKDTDTVLLNALQVSSRRFDRIHAPTFNARDIGGLGILGTDILRGQRVQFDFGRNEMTIVPSNVRERTPPTKTIVVRARSRFGRLVITDATVNGQPVQVIVDTGSQVSIGNRELRRRLQRRQQHKYLPVTLHSVTGAAADAEYGSVKGVTIGDVKINDLPIAFADVYAFRHFELMERPALILGMDALRLFDRVSIDFTSRKVRFSYKANSI